MTRNGLLAFAGAVGLLLPGVFLWERWGLLVWLDAAIAYCL